jgi:hypothetical protein
MSMEKTFTAKLIPKEEVANLKFPRAEIFKSSEQHAELRKKLEQATMLGNNEHSKIKIVFEDQEGPKMIETTIWATGEKNIVLKKGMTIPINRIVDISFF